MSLLETAEDRRAAEPAEQIIVEVVALAAVGKRDELDRAAGQRPGDVAAELEDVGLVILVERVVALGRRRPG